MWSTLRVYHSTQKDRENLEIPGSYSWSTCMRTIWITDSRIHREPSGLPITLEKYSGYQGYRFVLEVISGLHSKLLGETEVLSQFRNKFKILPSSAFGEYLARLRDSLIQDSRSIRSRYLQNIGEQSYGGLANKYLKDYDSVSILGTGQLAEKILPWLKHRNVLLVGRNQKRILELSKQFSVSIKLLNEWDPADRAIVIAAPIDLSSCMNSITSGTVVVDFREVPLEKDWPDTISYISFAEMLDSIRETEERTWRIRKMLQPFLDELIEERELEAQQFIFGWEELTCPAF
ncbi:MULTISPECIES: glutamyl-tRNAGlu reductase [Leptospira]|uniref:Glutamyl-tRNA reductase n=1 Tax=Leptospira kirschneri serovar Pomona TaxID=561005 RepID=A0A1T1DIE8_9LEPT|nr:MULTISPECIES: glutamyl-tRNAGlu reductase [Leptospira]EMJ89902.1 glutamyl-tRNAGlu reductase, N-terminal-like domain protein [Leptospira kirschneri str. JB]EMK03887.1 glutamyl-tRNAGlu reductase, N-terminal-like domain protein [Leptospira kirschneri]KXZ25454.1 glutamyl-tRNA reductase [Leptospira kirschneri]KXZ28717.1 glutamyl-tRNA reductase [Leptospira sp. ZV016]OOV40480.1 glutamyl-tRNA reductase [Leptospira kirschneri serovar Pomona]